MASVPDCPRKKGSEELGDRDPLERACLPRQAGEGVEMPAEMAVGRVKHGQGAQPTFSKFGVLAVVPSACLSDRGCVFCFLSCRTRCEPRAGAGGETSYGGSGGPRAFQPEVPLP